MKYTLYSKRHSQAGLPPGDPGTPSTESNGTEKAVTPVQPARSVDENNNPVQRNTSKSRNPKCARCRNHGEKVNVKGHKKSCPYSKCSCNCCILIEERRKVMAKQVALRRAQDLDEETGKQESFSKEIVLPEDLPEPDDPPPPQNGISPTPIKPSAFKFTGAGGITQEDQSRAESAMKRLIQMFGTTPQSCTTAFMALLKSVAFNLQEAYNKMLEGEVLKEQFEMTTKFDSGISTPTEQGALGYFGAQTNVRTLGLPLRAPVPVPTTSPTYPTAFPPSFLTSSPPAPLLYPSYNWSNCAAAYWSSPYFPNSAAAGAPPGTANGAAHHSEGPPSLAGPLYSFAVGAPPPQHRLAEVPSSGDSRGSAEYGSRDDGSDKEGPSQGALDSRTSPRQKLHRYNPYGRASGSKKRHFEETVSICEEGRIVPCETGNGRGNAEFRDARTVQPDGYGSGCSENEQCCE